MIFEFFVATYMYVDFFHQSKLVCHCQWWRPMFVQNIGFLAHIRPSVGAMLKIDCLTSIHSRVRVTIISVGLHHICFYCGTKLSSAVSWISSSWWWTCRWHGLWNWVLLMFFIESYAPWVMIYFIYWIGESSLMHHIIVREIGEIAECMFGNITLTYKID